MIWTEFGLCEKAHAVHTDSAAAVQCSMDVYETHSSSIGTVIDARQALCSVVRRTRVEQVAALGALPGVQEEALLAHRAPERTGDIDRTRQCLSLAGMCPRPS